MCNSSSSVLLVMVGSVSNFSYFYPCGSGSTQLNTGTGTSISTLDSDPNSQYWYILVYNGQN